MTTNIRRRVTEDWPDDPRLTLDDDLEEDKYGLEEYGFLVGYYGDDE